MKELRKILSTEAKRWKKIYPEYKDSIWEGTLIGLPCLAMPYIAIPEEKCNDWGGEKVTKAWERIENMGFVSTKEVLLWSHFGLHTTTTGEERLLFTDMESLKEVGKDKNRNC